LLVQFWSQSLNKKRVSFFEMVRVDPEPSSLALNWTTVVLSSYVITQDAMHKRARWNNLKFSTELCIFLQKWLPKTQRKKKTQSEIGLSKTWRSVNLWAGANSAEFMLPEKSRFLILALFLYIQIQSSNWNLRMFT